MIFYLSGTGNTRWVAEGIARATGDRLTDVAAAMNGNGGWHLEPGESLGFCFPVHGWRPPKLMREFIRDISLDGVAAEYCFAVCTAGDTVGEAMKIFRNDLLTRGIRLGACFDVRMPNTYVGLPFMDVDKKLVEDAKLRAAGIRIKEIAGRISAREQVDDMLFIGRWPRTNSRLLGSLFARKLVTDSRFGVDEDSCIRCGRCATVCPAGDILGGKGQLPSWKHNGRCMTCFSCYHHCSRHAIRFGRTTKGKGQYFFRHGE